MRRNCVKALALGGVAMIASALWGCSGGEKGLPTIDLIGNLNHEDVGDLDELFEVVDVISPELTDSSMLKMPAIGGFSDGVIYLYDGDYTSTRLMAFDVKTGKCLASFDHTGQGPGEYRFYYDAVFQGNPGHWTGLDTFYRRVTTYTADGEMIDSWPEMTILGLWPDGDGWIAVDNDFSRGRDEPVQLIRFDANFAPTDTVETRLPFDPFAVPRLYSTPEGPQFFVQDTLYSLADINNPVPILAFHTGHMKAPMDISGYEAAHQRDKYLVYFFKQMGDYVLVDYLNQGGSLCQIFDKRDGKLVYSRKAHYDPVTKKLVEGDPAFHLTVDGVKSRWYRISNSSEDLYVKQADEDVDEDTSNPKIARLRIKER